MSGIVQQMNRWIEGRKERSTAFPDGIPGASGQVLGGLKARKPGRVAQRKGPSMQYIHLPNEGR